MSSRKEQLQRTIARLYEVHGIKNGGIISTIQSSYYLSPIAYYLNREKYDLYWEITEILYELKYGKKYGD